APRIAHAVATLPRRLNAASHITPGNPAILSIALPRATTIRDPYFFPYDQDAIRHAVSQQPRVGLGGLSFRLAQGADHNLGGGPLSGVLTYVSAQGEHHAVEVEATPGATLPATEAAPAQGSAEIAALPAPAPAMQIDAGALFGAVVFAF